MASLTIVYLAALIAGVCLVVTRLWIEKPPGQAPAGGETRGPAVLLRGGEVGLPGTRAERSDEYLGGGGVGGAEGEGPPPAYLAPADGGIGGAEGDEESPAVRDPAVPLAAIVARFTLAFGAVGLLLTALWRSAPQGAVLALAGVVAILVASLGSPPRLDGEGPRGSQPGDGRA